MSHLTRLGALAVCLVGFAASACGPITEDRASELEATCAATDTDGTRAVDAFKELLVVEDAVTTSPLAMNANDGPLGFRHTMEQLAATPADAPAATRAWLEGWAPRTLTRDFNLAHAPFRLIGVANRIDLGDTAASHTGEARLLFGATDGAGDDPSSRALPITVIVEMRLPGDQATWASRWHALGARGHDGAIDADYTRALADLVSSFATSANLAQVRVNDATSSTGGTLLEFHGRPGGPLPTSMLVLVPLRRTPSHAIDGTAALRDFVTAHGDEVLADTFELPESMMTKRTARGTTWLLPGVDEPLRHAFAASTCDGCHGSEHPVVDSAFHVSPLRSGRAKVSRFLFDPAHPGNDELTRRAAILKRLACGT